MSDDCAIPRFRPGVKFRFDAVRQAWVVLAPERLFLPDDIAVEILQRVDGVRSTAQIVDDLAVAFSAPRDVIAGDVTVMLHSLSGRGAISL
jgi:pyrroloquinoline quinone biosynthesis protein D